MAVSNKQRNKIIIFLPPSVLALCTSVLLQAQLWSSSDAYVNMMLKCRVCKQLAQINEEERLSCIISDPPHLSGLLLSSVACPESQHYGRHILTHSKQRVSTPLQPNQKVVVMTVKSMNDVNQFPHPYLSSLLRTHPSHLAQTLRLKHRKILQTLTENLVMVVLRK